MIQLGIHGHVVADPDGGELAERSGKVSYQLGCRETGFSQCGAVFSADALDGIWQQLVDHLATAHQKPVADLDGSEVRRIMRAVGRTLLSEPAA